MAWAKYGENHWRARLTDRDVDLIFQLREQGLTIAAIARTMECGSTTVQKILRGEIRGRRA